MNVRRWWESSWIHFLFRHMVNKFTIYSLEAKGLRQCQIWSIFGQLLKNYLVYHVSFENVTVAAVWIMANWKMLFYVEWKIILTICLPLIPPGYANDSRFNKVATQYLNAILELIYIIMNQDRNIRNPAWLSQDLEPWALPINACM